MQGRDTTDPRGTTRDDSTAVDLVVNFAHSLCRRLQVTDPENTADDVAQDVCLKLLRLGLLEECEARVQRGQPVRAFLRACVLNRIRDGLKRTARAHERAAALFEHRSSDRGSVETTPDDRLDLQDSLVALWNACTTPADARMLLVLHNHVQSGDPINVACRSLMSPSMFRATRAHFRARPAVLRILRDAA